VIFIKFYERALFF